MVQDDHIHLIQRMVVLVSDAAYSRGGEEAFFVIENNELPQYLRFGVKTEPGAAQLSLLHARAKRVCNIPYPETGASVFEAESSIRKSERGCAPKVHLPA